MIESAELKDEQNVYRIGDKNMFERCMASVTKHKSIDLKNVKISVSIVW